ncbi:hypothetical protein AB1Y20_013595 [Prymnesium parvum]|uniref:Glucanase n=1 Tax=Prymnesium parvum TaxID=97485 RepID=A0AB34IIB1_PRYPA
MSASDDSANAFAAAKHKFWVDPVVRQRLDELFLHGAEDQASLDVLRSTESLPSAFWLDSIAKIQDASASLQGLLADVTAQHAPPLLVLVLSNLPDRRCDLLRGAQICCAYRSDGSCQPAASGACEKGIAEYAQNFIDPIAALLRRHAEVPLAVVLEPAALPSLSTRHDPGTLGRCAGNATYAAYTTGLRYAVHKLHEAAPHASLYLDAGHGGSLRSRGARENFAHLVADLGIHPRLRGFSTNVGAYQPIGTACPASAFPLAAYCRGPWGLSHPLPPCCRDPCAPSGYATSDGNNELNFVQALDMQLRQVIPDFRPRFLIDTARNGVDDMRESCANWCNIRGAGLGLWPRVDTALPQLIDAYFWIRHPGLSDGCTSQLLGGSDCEPQCASADSVGLGFHEPEAPNAGEWFRWQLVQLASHAHMQRQDPSVLGLRGLPRIRASSPLMSGGVKSAGAGSASVQAEHPPSSPKLVAEREVTGEDPSIAPTLLATTQLLDNDESIDSLVFVLAAALPLLIGMSVLRKAMLSRRVKDTRNNHCNLSTGDDATPLNQSDGDAYLMKEASANAHHYRPVD